MDLKRELIDAGNRLLSPPDQIDQLLNLLDRVENCLSYVEQQPVVGIQDALCPTFKALITDELLKHPDADVRVGVTACLTEISRITAPDIPYNDDVMKDVFRLTISAFKGLDDNSSKLFSKRVSILEIVARVRSCAILLDLECNDLVIEMFQIFYKSIRDFHDAVVFASMESIMSLVIEESEEISSDILFTLLSILRKDNKEALPIARELGEKVVQNCAAILKPYIVEGIKSLKINLVDYDFVVTLVCEVTQDKIPVTDSIVCVPEVDGNESVMVVNEAAQKVLVESNGNTEVAGASNGTAEVGEDANMDMQNTSNKPNSTVVVAEIIQDQDQAHPEHDAPTTDIEMNPKPASSAKSEQKSVKVAKKRGRKPKIAKEVTKQTNSSNMPQPDSYNHPVPHRAPPEESSVKLNTVENQSDSIPKAMGNNPIVLGSPSLSKGLPGKSSTKMNKKSKKAILTHEKKSSHRNMETDIPDELDDTENKLLCSVKDSHGVDDVASKPALLVEVNKAQAFKDGSEDTSLKQTKETLVTPRMKKRGRPRKDASLSATTGDKGRFPPVEDGKQLGEELVGSRIKVWWPQDKEFYDGIVESFDSVKKKHQILYTDNEREVLNLHKQKWKLVESEGSEKNGEISHTNDGDSSETPQIKKLKMDSDSGGKLGNSDTPPKRRGRPPKSATALGSHVSAGKGIKPEGEIIADESKIDSKADVGNPVKSVESPSNTIPNLNDLVMGSEQETEVPGSDVKQANEDLTLGNSAVDNVVPKGATVGININEPFTIGNDESPNIDLETTIPKGGHSDVNVTREAILDPSGGSRTEELNKLISVSDTTKVPRKRKARTSSNSNSPTVPGKADTLVKRRRKPSKILVGNIDEKSEILKKQFSDSKIDELSGGHSGSLLLVNSEDSLVEGRNMSNINAELKLSEHRVLDENIAKSIVYGTKTEDAVEQVSSKSTAGEPKSSSLTGQNLKLKTTYAQSKVQRKNVRKTTSSSSEQAKQDSPVKRSRGRPCKPKTGDPKSDSKHDGSNHSTAGGQHNSDSAGAVKPDTHEDSPNMNNVPKDSVSLDMVMKDKQDSSEHIEDLDLKLDPVTKSRGEDASETSPVGEASKENMAILSSLKEQQNEANASHDGQKMSRKTRSKKHKGGEVLSS